MNRREVVQEIQGFQGLCIRRLGQQNAMQVLGSSLMAERRRRPDLPPRWLTIGEVAQYLGHSASWLTPERLARLQETGFPVVDGSLERIDREAIDDWSDRRSGRRHIC